MPRSTRRTRAQGAGPRKRPEPNIPHHLIRRGGPATLEPTQGEALPVQESDAVPATDAPRVDRTFAGGRPLGGAPAAARPAGAGRTAATTDQARRLVTDYGYVIGELKRIFITAAIVVIALVVIALLRR